MNDKNYFEMTGEKVAKQEKLTPKEQAAVDALMAAMKALPKSICISVDDIFQNDGTEPNFEVYKRITKGSSHRVAFLRKKSLSF